MVAERDFDPAKDAARIETAVKTKGERITATIIVVPSVTVYRFIMILRLEIRCELDGCINISVTMYLH